MGSAFIILPPICKAVDFDISHHATRVDNFPRNKFYILKKKPLLRVNCIENNIFVSFCT